MTLLGFYYGKKPRFESRNSESDFLPTSRGLVCAAFYVGGTVYDHRYKPFFISHTDSWSQYPTNNLEVWAFRKTPESEIRITMQKTFVG